jgi:hypothetical protein
MIGPEGYGRYDDDPEHVGCPRAQSDMTPCIARDGAVCLADDDMCVGCGANPCDLLAALRHTVTGKSRSPVVAPKHAADKLAREVRIATR